MTQITAGTLIRLPPTPFTHNDQEQPARPAREHTPQGALVSLAEPPLGAESQSLEAVLLERLARCATPLRAEVPFKELSDLDKALKKLLPYAPLTHDPSNGPGPVLRDWTDQDEASARVVSAAINAILALDERDEILTTDRGVLQEAVHLLLALGQPRLLLRLAQLNALKNIVFEVGLNPHSASVLARIGASWPPDVSVSITLDSGLSTPCVRALQAFMHRPLFLSVHVRASGTSDVNAAHEFAQLFGHRPLEQLTLDIREVSTDLLQAMVGVRAGTLCIRATRMFGTPDAPNASTAAYQDAAFELVRKSGARVLKLPQSHVEGDFCARLLAINDHWDAVELNLSAPSAARDWLIAARQTIAQLALASWTGSGATDIADLLQWAENNRVGVLVFHDTVNLRHIAGGLDMRLLKSTHVFDTIEACFAVGSSDSTKPSDANDLNAVYPWLKALSANPLFTSLRHISPGVLRNERPSRKAGEPIPSELRDLLHARSDMNRAGASTDRRLKECWVLAIQTLGLLLSPGVELQEVLDYLKNPDSPLVNRSDSNFTLELYGTMLPTKLGAFKLAGLDTRLIKGAVAHSVRKQPGCGLEMYHALVKVGLLSRQQSPDDWERLGSRYALAWSSEGFEISNEEARVAVEVANATPSGVLSSDAMLPQWKGRMDFVTPSTWERLEEVTLACEAWVEACSRLDDRFKARKDALGLVLGLLQNGSFDPKVLNAENVASELATHLLQHGQGKMLRHIIHHAPTPRVWSLDATDAMVVAEIAQLRPWPEDATCKCDLRIGAQLGLDDGVLLADFVASVKPEQLTVRLDVAAYAQPEMVTNIINARPGIALVLRSDGAEVPAEGPLVHLLSSVNVPLRALAIDGSRIDGAAPVQAVIDLIRTCRVNSLEILDGTPHFVEAVLPCRPWDSLKLECSIQFTTPFLKGGVSARELHIVVLSQGDKFVPIASQTMVAFCKKLKVVVFEGAAVNVLDVARGLDRNRGVRSFEAPLAARSDTEANEALKILRRNTSIARVMLRAVELDGDSLIPLKPSFNEELAQLAKLNRSRQPVSSHVEAVNSLAYTVSGRDLGDVGQKLAVLLDPQDTLALSRTNKAAYVRSRRPWESEIDRLAALFKITSGAEFKEKLGLQLNVVDSQFAEVSGTVPSPSTRPNVLEKMAIMQAAGVPHHALVQALGRALHLDKGASMDYLAATLVWGVLPAEVWLKEVLDIDVLHLGVAL